MFEALVYCLKGIWLHPYTITLARLAPDMGTQGHLQSVNLGWESCRHVGDMSAWQPNVGTFGQHPPVVVTQNQSLHSIFVLGIANIHPICIQVPELHTQNSSVRFVRNIWLYYICSDCTFLLLSMHKWQSIALAASSCSIEQHLPPQHKLQHQHWAGSSISILLQVSNPHLPPSPCQNPCTTKGA